MARDFVEQYKFNKKVNPTMFNLLKVKKLSHESFEEYVILWRIEAFKIHHLPHEEELVQTLIRSLEGIDTLKLTSQIRSNVVVSSKEPN